MKEDELQKAIDILQDIKKYQRLHEHFIETNISDPIAEVRELLDGYRNLMM